MRLGAAVMASKRRLDVLFMMCGEVRRCEVWKCLPAQYTSSTLVAASLVQCVSAPLPSVIKVSVLSRRLLRQRTSRDSRH